MQEVVHQEKDPGLRSSFRTTSEVAVVVDTFADARWARPENQTFSHVLKLIPKIEPR